MLLTTHSMEEADVLSNRIGIISLGRLRCIGAPLHLKHKFGLGYRLTVLCINKESGPHVEKYIQSLLPKATQLSNFEGADQPASTTYLYLSCFYILFIIYHYL